MEVLDYHSKNYDLTVDLSDPENDAIELSVSDSFDFVSLINNSIVFNPSGVVTSGDGYLNENISLYLSDSHNPSTVNQVFFTVKENHPPLIKGRYEVETTAYSSETI